MHNDSFDVAVVGYGPTGLTLAAALGKLGHSVVVIERWPALYGLPRLSHIDDETARIVQAIADADHALRDAEPIAEFHFMNASGETLTRVGPGPGAGPCGFPHDISIHQPDIEAAIDQRLRALPSVTLLLGHELLALEATAAVVGLEVRNKGGDASGARQQIRARFVVGCDGARSTVRNCLGVELFEHDFEERWLNIDTEVLRPLADNFRETVQCCDPSRGHMHMPIGRRRLRFELAVLRGEDAEGFKRPEFAWQWLQAKHGLGPEDVRILRQIVYTFGARVAKRWRVGNILLAGDAAHTMPPYLGQGACSGMRDGFNLAWKLDLVLRGITPVEILDSYEAERRPHVAAITQAALALGRMANEHDPERARQRDEYLKAHPPTKPAIPGLVAGILDSGHSRLAGSIWPQGIVRYRLTEGRFDTVVGNGFVLLSDTDLDEVLGGERVAALDALGVKRVSLDSPDLVDSGGTYRRYLAGHGIGAVLARPDFIVFGTAQDAAEVPGLIDRLVAKIHSANSASIRANPASIPESIPEAAAPSRASFES